MMTPWDWLRHKTCGAVLDGFADAVERIDRGQVERLQERLALALAAPKPDAADPPGNEGATDAAPPRSGKRGAR